MGSSDAGRPPMLRDVDRGPMAWTNDSLPAEAGLVRVDEACRDEVLKTAAYLEANPLPILSLRPTDFEMPLCRAVMARAKDILVQGIGFVVIDRLPVDEMSRETATALDWLLVNMVGQTVAQKWDGTMVYDVRDTGLKREAGSGIRSSITNEGQGYHTDNAFNVPPNYVTLFCLRPAKEGGVNGVVSFQTAHNRMLEQHPDLLERLYEPFYFDRQQEHAPDDPDKVSRSPIFRYDSGKLHTQFADMLVYAGYKVAGVEMDDRGRAAIEALTSIIEESDARHDFMFEPGQIQIVDNRRLGHRRTAYTDWPEPDQRRHLVRLWIRDEGRPFYLG
jgi:alpha-ketoglutarate-dependent taurine dioxygenase